MENKFLEFANGVKIPQLGFGLSRLKDCTEFERVVQTAIDVGYRHFDTAKIYGNEQLLGDQIVKSKIPRQEFFIVSKVWTTSHGYKQTLKAFERTCKRLRVEYLDMYLIHFAARHFVETWDAMQELYQTKKVRAIGVANFEKQHIETLKKHASILPMVNQIETHPEFAQNGLIEYMAQNQILHEAWGPLGRGSKELLQDTRLQAIAAKYQKTTAQVILNWHIARNSIVIPRSSNPARIKENSQIFDFLLLDADMQAIDSMDIGKRYSYKPTGMMTNPVYVGLMKLFGL